MADVRYTVYDNRTDRPIIIEGTSVQCAKAMGMKIKSFYTTVSHVTKGRRKHYNITKHIIEGCKEPNYD